MPGAVSFPYCPERKLNTVSLPAEYGLHMLLFSSDLKPVIIELNSGKIFMSGIVKSAKEDYNKYDGFLS